MKKVEINEIVFGIMSENKEAKVIIERIKSESIARDPRILIVIFASLSPSLKMINPKISDIKK